MDEKQLSAEFGLYVCMINEDETITPLGLSKSQASLLMATLGAVSKNEPLVRSDKVYKLVEAGYTLPRTQVLEDERRWAVGDKVMFRAPYTKAARTYVCTRACTGGPLEPKNESCFKLSNP